jgi:hypothetical protein
LVVNLNLDLECSVTQLDFITVFKIVFGELELSRFFWGLVGLALSDFFSVDVSTVETPTRIKSATLNPILQAAPRHILGKYQGTALNTSHIVTANRVRMQPQVYPSLRLSLKTLHTSCCCHNFRLRAFHRKVNIPSLVTHLVNARPMTVNRVTL